MINFKRSEFNTLISRLDEKPDNIIFVTGPRQVGKTTMVKQVLTQVNRPYLYTSVDEPDPWEQNLSSQSGGMWDEAERDMTAWAPPNFEITHSLDERNQRWIVKVWEKARRACQETDSEFVLAIDEIQKISNWSETVKGLWDADRSYNLPLHIILLGSAPILLQQGMNESLAGRFETIPMVHWSFYEMSEAFNYDLDQFIFFGGYPRGANYIKDQERWGKFITEGIIEPNIEKDILALTRIDKPSLLKNLFFLGTNYSGQIFSFNKMLGQLQDAGNTTTLARYLELLSKVGLLTGLQKYSAKPYLRKSSSPKLNILNTALMTANSGYSFEEAMADRSYWGRLVESAVGAHLFNTRSHGMELFFWRENHHEVDFVLKKGPNLISIEVKSGKHESNLEGLKSFDRKFNPKSSYVVGENGIPLAEFLLTPAKEWFEL